MPRHVIGHTHDLEADAVYIRLSRKPYAFGEEIGPERRIDYAADGTPIGIELLAVSNGVDLDGLPFRDEVGAVLGEAGIPILATH